MNIREIAHFCGVSTATISRVLNNSPDVKEKTRAHVLSVMAEHGYTPNAFARGLGLNSMRAIGILCTDIDDLYYAKAVSILEALLRERGYETMLSCTGADLEDKKRALLRLLDKRVDALILVGSAFRESRDNSHILHAAGRVPVVIINGLIEAPNVYCVLCNEKEAMEKNVRLLAEQGCANIAYVYDTLTYSGGQKLEGYRAGLAACGIEERREWELRTEKNISSVRAAVRGLLERHSEITAVLASEDLLAVGTQKAMADVGRILPIIGFNNSRYAACATPELTSVDNMLETLCPTAVNLLGDLLAGQKAPQKIMVSATLVERETFRSKEGATE